MRDITDYDILYFLSFYHKNSTVFSLKLWLKQYTRISISQLYYLVYNAKLPTKFEKHVHENCTCNIGEQFKNNVINFPDCSHKFTLKPLNFKIKKATLFLGYKLNSIILYELQTKKNKTTTPIENEDAKILSYYIAQITNGVSSFRDYLFLKLLLSRKKIFRNILPRRWRSVDRNMFDSNTENVLISFENYQSINRQENQELSSYTVKFDKPTLIYEIPKNIEDYIVQYDFNTPVFILDKIKNFYHAYDLNGYPIRLNRVSFSKLKKYNIITLLVTMVEDELVILDVFRIYDKNITHLSTTVRYQVIIHEFENKIKIASQVNPYEAYIEYENTMKKCSSIRLPYSGLIFKSKSNHIMFRYKFPQEFIHIFNLESGKKFVIDKKQLERINFKTENFLIVPNKSNKYKLSFLCRLERKNSLMFCIWDLFRFRDYVVMDLDSSVLNVKNFMTYYVDTYTGYKSCQCFVCVVHFNNITTEYTIQDVYDVHVIYPPIIYKTASIDDIKSLVVK